MSINVNIKELSVQEKREIARRLLAQGSARVEDGAKSAAQAANPGRPQEIPPEHYNFDQFPEYRAFVAQSERARQSGLIKGNPYFVPHDGLSNNAIVIGENKLINYSGYNYLGLSGHPEVSTAAKAAIDRYGTSVCASRVVSGEIALHSALENALAKRLQTEACAAFVSGWGTNVSTIGHLLRKGDLIVHDALVHNSALMGCILSGSRRIAFPHNNVRELDRILAENRQHYERVLIVVEGVYSMDGDIVPLPELIAVKRRHKALLMVDEAHSIGVLGKTGGGVREHFDIDSKDVDIWMGTLSKAFASCGGYIAGSKALVENLKYLSSGFVYSVGLPAANTAAALAAVEVLEREPDRVLSLHARSAQFLEGAKALGLNTGPSSGSPVIPIILGNSLACMRLSQQLFQRGVEAKPVLYPAVAESEARLRFFVTALHSRAEIANTLRILGEEIAKLGAAV